MDMGHGGMDHGDRSMADDHAGHGASMCKMNMVFTWDPTDVCVVFQWWHIRGPSTFIASLVGIVLLGAGYEYLRTLTYPQLIPRSDVIELDSNDSPNTPLSTAQTVIDNTSRSPATPSDNSKYGTLTTVTEFSVVERHGKTKRSVLYAIQVIYSTFIMLITMTYNGWIIIAVGAGALIGHLIFGAKAQSRTMSCH
ncbi:Ctr copper transporter family-domain-containing protein [Lipomyces starkeyi]